MRLSPRAKFFSATAIRTSRTISWAEAIPSSAQERMTRRMSDTQLVVREADAGFEIFALAVDARFLRCRRRRRFVRLPLICQRQEARELPRRRVSIAVPEFRIVHVKHTRAGDDHFQRKRAPRTKLAVFSGILPDPDIPFTHAHPLHGDAALVSPHGSVADVAGEHI